MRLPWQRFGEPEGVFVGRRQVGRGEREVVGLPAKPTSLAAAVRWAVDNPIR
jgi:hypothetical protein